MHTGLDGKVAIVTGGASNIGRAISHELAAEGCTVAIFDTDEDMAEHTTGEIVAAGHQAVSYRVDLTDLEETTAAAAAVDADHGPVRVLVNNVGWNGSSEFFLNLEPERWTKAFRLNLLTTMTGTRAVLPSMVSRRDGVIVSISSDAAFGEHRLADYGAMKAGIMAFTRTIAKEYGRFGIRANTICPGMVIPDDESIGSGSLWRGQSQEMRDDLAKSVEAGIPLRRRPAATDIAWSVVFLASERARMLTGQVLSVSGGFAMPR